MKGMKASMKAMLFILTCLSFLITIDSFHSLSFSEQSGHKIGQRSGISSSIYSASKPETPQSVSKSVYELQVPGSIMTLSRFMIEATRTNPDHADFESLIASIQIACKTIANLVSRAGISDLTGLQSSSKRFDANPMGGSATTSTTGLGDSAMSASLYDMANTVLKNSLRFTGKIGVVSPTNEGDQPLLVEEAWNSKYVAVFDALDGASNIDVGIVTGTIFGIFKETDECLTDFGEEVSEEGQERLLEALIPGKSLVASGYCMYSSSTG
jgi:fructose-1,6-bisphosphatase I